MDQREWLLVSQNPDFDIAATEWDFTEIKEIDLHNQNKLARKSTRRKLRIKLT